MENIEEKLTRHENDLFAGGGEMGERIKNYPWEQTAVGPVENWPQSLRTVIRIMLTSRQPIWVVWGREMVMFYNDAYRSILGSKHPASLGKPIAQVWAEVWHEVGDLLEGVFNNNEGVYLESQQLVLERHGYPEETYFTFSYNPVPDENGKVGGLICTNTDDTQRVIGERQLDLLKKVASANAGLQSTGEAGRSNMEILSSASHPDVPFALLYLYDAAKNELSLAGSAAVKGDESILAPELLRLNEYSFWPFAEVIASGSSAVIERLPEKYVQSTGKAWPMSCYSAVITPLVLGHDDKINGLLITGLNPLRKFDTGYSGFISLLASQIASNIVNAAKYETERMRIKSLEEIDKAKTVFFSNISHEFRTPITLMLGPLEEILNRPSANLGVQERENLEITHRNAVRLLKLVNSLLDFSRIESGRQQASFELVDIRDVTRDLASNFFSIIEKAGLFFRIEADAFVKPVYLDRLMWEKIVFNLLSNAFKYTLSGGITLRLYCQDQNAVLEVEDTGVGIPAEELPRVFERFHRIENTRGRSFEGTGIGLSLVKELVKLHGGTISLKSELNKGSVFSITIPFGKKHLAAETIRDAGVFSRNLVTEAYIEDTSSLVSPVFDDHTETDPAKSTIMVADDNADMRHYLMTLLRNQYNVVTAANGLDALHKVLEAPVDLVVSDVMMPIMNGFALLRELRLHERTQKIPVIMLSARAGEEATIEGVEAGADDYLVKPFSSKELLARIAAHLEMASVRKKAETATETERSRLYRLFMQAPAVIAVLRGPELRFELANQRYLEVAGKDHSIIGKPVMEALPELKGQAIEKILFDVYKTGEVFLGNEVPVELQRQSGNRETVYFNFVYQPYLNDRNEVEGILVHAVDVSAQVKKNGAAQVSSVTG